MGKIICTICGTESYRRPSEIIVGRKSYCSRKCASLGLYKSSPKLCTICDIQYRTAISQEKYRGKSKFCSKACKGVSMSIVQQGENNPNWRGGVSTLHHRLRQSKAFKNWRKAVFERDNYTCQFCNIRGGYLEPDHIKPFAYFPELRFDPNNGRTLCKPCHKTTDTYGNKAKVLYGMAKS